MPANYPQFLSHQGVQFKASRCFSLFHQIYSERDLVRRRNPRFWRFGAAEKQRDRRCFSLFFAVFRRNSTRSRRSNITGTSPSMASELDPTIPYPQFFVNLINAKILEVVRQGSPETSEDAPFHRPECGEIDQHPRGPRPLLQSSNSA